MLQCMVCAFLGNIICVKSQFKLSPFLGEWGSSLIDIMLSRY